VGILYDVKLFFLLLQGHTKRKEKVFQFNSVHFIQRNITNYEFASGVFNQMRVIIKYTGKRKPKRRDLIGKRSHVVFHTDSAAGLKETTSPHRHLLLRARRPAASV